MKSTDCWCGKPGTTTDGSIQWVCEAHRGSERFKAEIVALLTAPRETPSYFDLCDRGGEWLGAARKWIQWHRHNGDSVTWGSDDELRPTMTVRDVEDLAAEVAVAAMRDFVRGK